MRRRCEMDVYHNTHHNIIDIIIIIIKRENQLHVFRARCPRARETIDSVRINDNSFETMLFDRAMGRRAQRMRII